MKDTNKSIVIKNIGDLGNNISNFKKMGYEQIGYYTVGGTTFLQVVWANPLYNKEDN